MHFKICQICRNLTELLVVKNSNEQISDTLIVNRTSATNKWLCSNFNVESRFKVSFTNQEQGNIFLEYFLSFILNRHILHQGFPFYKLLLNSLNSSTYLMKIHTDVCVHVRQNIPIF